MQKNIDWLFNVGQVVRFHDMIGTVLGRDASWCGRQLYRIHITGESYGRPFRLVSTLYLVAV